MISSFKTKKIKGSPSGYFVTKEDFNSKKFKGFKNIGNTKVALLPTFWGFT